MTATAELNSELQTTVNKRFEDLLKEIGPNRQQLSTKVSMAYHELHKELSKEKVDAKRKGAILQEIKQIEKMAAQQLPHHLKKPGTVSAPLSQKISKPVSASVEPKKEEKKAPPPTEKKSIPKPSASKPAAKKKK
jgi:hypothetical protein